jgi:hypothetical protein
MRDAKTRSLKAMLRSRIVAAPSSDFVSRIVARASATKQIKGALLMGQIAQSLLFTGTSKKGPSALDRQAGAAHDAAAPSQARRLLRASSIVRSR